MYINPEAFSGRPEDKRSPEETGIYDALDKLSIPFTRADHEYAHTMEDCLAIEKVLQGQIPKNLFLTNRQQTEFYLLIMPGDKPFKTKYLSSQLNCTRLSFGGPEQLAGLLRTIQGSVSPLELIYDANRRIRFIADRELMGSDCFCGHPGIATSTVKLSWSDFLKYVNACGHEITWVTLPREEEMHG